ncbi:SUR7-domain-containing protein [Patellaria atrata CBS 101060]|uniref:SUR7-domain-containing protein n=1 Tax=Patellaria atrata CBS 101060 TaxID=1346257 RepID=A0A9P4VPS2_9PEZI|nr:SUR7-domain-containing protein [Patellaria atrata CBS 101060]
MAGGRPILALLSLVILAGGILLQFLVILTGAVNSSPLDGIYFLQAATSGIPGARNPSRWTFFAICGRDSSGHNADCGSPVPALPFDPPRNFGTEQGIADQFIGTKRFFYLSRFMFAFYLIALFFAACALALGLLALFSRLGGYLGGLMTSLALFFQTLAACLMTAWTVLGRNHFRSNDQPAKLGVKAYGFTWAAVACFFLSTILFCCGGAVGRRDNTYASSGRRSGGGGLFSKFGRKRSTRSRGSFVDGERGRVKDEYS